MQIRSQSLARPSKLPRSFARPDSSLRIAALVGFLAASISFLIRANLAPGAWDLSWPLAGARALLSGQNPYTAPMPGGLPLFYPIPALLIVAPLVSMPDIFGATVFVGMSFGLLTWAIQTQRPQAWPVLISAPCVCAMAWAQWAPLMMAAALLPSLLPLAMVKPNIGLPIFLARRPRLKPLLVCCALALLILIAWLFDWLRNTRTHDSALPLLTLPGLIFPLALIQWRSERARLFLGMAIMPQRFYDPLMLWLIPRTAHGGLVLSILSWLMLGPWLVKAFQQALAQPPITTVALALYVPALAMLLFEDVQRRRIQTQSLGTQ